MAWIYPTTYYRTENRTTSMLCFRSASAERSDKIVRESLPAAFHFVQYSIAQTENGDARQSFYMASGGRMNRFFYKGGPRHRRWRVQGCATAPTDSLQPSVL